MAFSNKIRKNLYKYIILILLHINITTSINATNSTTNNSEIKDETPEIYKRIVSIKLKDISILNKLLNETDSPTFAYFYTKKSKNSIIGAEMIRMISEKLDFLVNIILVDCEEFTPSNYTYCVRDPDAQDGFPRMVIYQQPEYRNNPYTGKRVFHSEYLYQQKEVTEAKIYNFITSYIRGKTVKLNSENIEGFLNNNIFNKVILFTEREETSILYKGISSFFHDQILFGEISKNNKALVKKFGIKTYPTLLVYVTQEDNMYLDEPRIEQFQGKIISRDIVYFIGQYALKEKLYLKLERKENLDDLKYKVAMKDLNEKDYLDYLGKFVSKRFIIYLTNSQDEENKEIPADLKKLSKNTNGFFLFARFNCSGEKEAFCKETFNVEKFPSLLMVHKTVADEKNSQTSDLKRRLQKPIILSLDYNSLEEEIVTEFGYKLKNMNTYNIAELIKNAELEKVTPLIYFHHGKIPLGLKLLSNEDIYRKYVMFYEFSYPQSEIMKKFQITKVPSAIFLIKNREGNGDNMRVVQYNEELVFSRLRNFINQNFNVQRPTLKYIEEDIIEKKDINFVSSTSTIKQDCIKANKKLCIFGFLDGRFKKDSKKSFRNSIRILEEVLNKKENHPYYFGWVNSTCQNEFTETFHVDLNQIPNVSIYVPSKNIFSNLIGAFDSDNINNLIQKTLNGKVHFNKIDKDKINLVDRKCNLLREVDEVLEDDEILMEMKEDIERRKIEEALERERIRKNEEYKEKRNKENKKKDL